MDWAEGHEEREKAFEKNVGRARIGKGRVTYLRHGNLS